MLAQCEVAPQIFDDMIKRLDEFATGYVGSTEKRFLVFKFFDNKEIRL
jgi:hypothetical protein